MSRPAYVIALAAALLVAGCASPPPPAAVAEAPVPRPVLEVGAENPMIAQGVVLPPGAATYKTSGIGPEQLNATVADGTPEAFVDLTTFGGALPEGVSVTEAQGLNVLDVIRANLEAQGLGLQDVTTMRVFLDNAPGTDRADYAGWNRAYRQYFANTNLITGDTELVPMGTGEPAAPLVRNPARPTRFALEVQSLPVLGWLVEVEVDAVYPGGP